MSQFMSRPMVAADTAVKHVILYLKGTANMGVLLGYNLANKSKLSEFMNVMIPMNMSRIW